MQRRFFSKKMVVGVSLAVAGASAAVAQSADTIKVGVLHSLSGKGRYSVVVVEHDMEFVTRIANQVTVLHEGSVLAEGTMEQVQSDERVIEVYLGR